MNYNKNKYYYRSHISEAKFRQLLKCFAVDLNAFEASKFTHISHHSCKVIYAKLRLHIAEFCINYPAQMGEFELDESYFGARRVRGKKGRGAAGKTPVFGVLKRDGNVYVQIVRNCSKAQLMPIIQGKILEGSTIHTDGWKAYDGLILNGYQHYRVYHSKDEFVRGKSHVNGIEPKVGVANPSGRSQKEGSLSSMVSQIKLSLYTSLNASSDSTRVIIISMIYYSLV